MGGALTGIVQWVIEGRRARHERELDAVRAQRERDDAQQAARSLARVAARVMTDDFTRVSVQWETEREADRWYLGEFPMRSQVTPDERRVLAGWLDDDAWITLSYVEGKIELVNDRRRERRAELGEGAVEAKFEDDDREIVKEGIAALESAIDALEPLATREVE